MVVCSVTFFFCGSFAACLSQIIQRTTQQKNTSYVCRICSECLLVVVSDVTVMITVLPQNALENTLDKAHVLELPSQRYRIHGGGISGERNE
jgi:hypothetical protein